MSEGGDGAGPAGTGRGAGPAGTGRRAGPRRRFLVAAFGDPGHAFPAIALGAELARRGHDVCLQTWRRWKEHVEAEGMRFAAAPEYHVWPDVGQSLPPYVAAVRAARETEPLVREFAPDAMVADILTVAGALAAEMAGAPWATLIPHLLPTSEPGFPLYSTGARLPRTRLGARVWQLLDPLPAGGYRQGRDQLNESRRRVGLPPLDHIHGGISRRLALVGTFPQLEYPRAEWPQWATVTGPLLWERPATAPEEVALPPGDDPLVLIAPSTSQDPEGRMLAAALEGLAGEPVRVLAATARRALPAGTEVPANARLADWLSYRATMPHCAAVVCHAGMGTVGQALAAGAPLVACPGGGDMAETAARVAWSGGGVALPRRLTTPKGIRLAVRKLLGEPRYARRAGEIAAWSRAHPGPPAAADAVEAFAASAEPQRGGTAEPHGGARAGGAGG